MLTRKLYTCWVGLFFALFALFVAIPKAWFYRLCWGNDEQRKLQYHTWFCHCFRWMCRHLHGVTIRFDNSVGEEFLQPAIIIANHESHLDLLCLIALHPRIVAMTNQWVWNFPLYAPVIHYLEYYPSTQGLDNNQQHIADLLSRGYSVIVFPEGTRSLDSRILKFHRGAFYLAEQLHADILPIYLSHPGHILPKHDLCIRKGTIDVTIGQRVCADDVSMGDNYREKTRRWHQHFLNRFLLLFVSLFLITASTLARNRLTAFLPDSSVVQPSDLAILVCPGGSYSWRDMPTEGTGVARWLQGQGIPAYTLRYRVQGGFAFASGIRFLIRGHRHPDPIDDLQEALALLKQQYRHVGVMGFSAGGHLAMSSTYLTASDGSAVRPDFVVPVYPVVTLRQKPYVHRRSRRALLGEYRRFKTSLRDSLSLELHVPADCPPVFLANCIDDPIVHYHNSELLDSALTAQHVPHRYLQFQRGGHGFGADSLKTSSEAISWKAEFLQWLNNRK